MVGFGRVLYSVKQDHVLAVVVLKTYLHRQSPHLAVHGNRELKWSRLDLIENCSGGYLVRECSILVLRDRGRDHSLLLVDDHIRVDRVDKLQDFSSQRDQHDRAMRVEFLCPTSHPYVLQAWVCR